MVQPGNEAHVHHMLIYSCSGKNMSAYVNRGGDCFAGDTTPTDTCTLVIGAWAIGGDPYIYPNNMGKPFFLPEQQYLMMEIHYDNSNFDKGLINIYIVVYEFDETRLGIVDSSYYRFYLTSKPRPIQVGLFVITEPVSPILQVIPPHQSAYTTYVYCSANCTSRLTKPIYFIAGGLHGHLTGSVSTLFNRNTFVFSSSDSSSSYSKWYRVDTNSIR